MVPALLEKIKSCKQKLHLIGVVVFGATALAGAMRLYAITGSKPEVRLEKGAFSIHQKEGSENTALLFVGSKNGARYYPASCSSARRIKEENKIYFSSAEDAEKAGYTKSPTCSY